MIFINLQSTVNHLSDAVRSLYHQAQKDDDDIANAGDKMEH